MRKLLSKVLVLTAMTAIFLTATAAAAEIGSGVIDADSLRVRSEPSTSSSTVTFLSDGTKVKVLEALDGWYQISWSSYTGYVSADYLSYTPASTPAAAPAAQSIAETPAPAAASPASAAGKTGVITGSEVNFRSAPSTDAGILASLAEGTQIAISSVDNGWCKASCNGQEGYVSAEYVAVDGIPLVDPKGLITGSCVNIRSAPSTDASILGKVYAGKLVDLISLQNDWYAINYNGSTGYISSDYLKVYTGSAASGAGASIVETAMSYLGTPYSYGGASPKGFDCSGFTMYVFSLFGYSLPHSATSQWNSSGTYVERSDLQPGDLVLFCDPSRSGGKACSHVGIYIGDNNFVHASSGSSGKYVRTSSLNESYYSGYYVGAKRVA